MHWYCLKRSKLTGSQRNRKDYLKVGMSPLPSLLQLWIQKSDFPAYIFSYVIQLLAIPSYYIVFLERSVRVDTAGALYLGKCMPVAYKTEASFSWKMKWLLCKHSFFFFLAHSTFTALLAQTVILAGTAGQCWRRSAVLLQCAAFCNGSTVLKKDHSEASQVSYSWVTLGI